MICAASRRHPGSNTPKPTRRPVAGPIPQTNNGSLSHYAYRHAYRHVDRHVYRQSSNTSPSQKALFAFAFGTDFLFERGRAPVTFSASRREMQEMAAAVGSSPPLGTHRPVADVRYKREQQWQCAWQCMTGSGPQCWQLRTSSSKVTPLSEILVRSEEPAVHRASACSLPQQQTSNNQTTTQPMCTGMAHLASDGGRLFPPPPVSDHGGGLPSYLQGRQEASETEMSTGGINTRPLGCSICMQATWCDQSV